MLAGAGCAADPCRTTCADLARSFGACLDGWGLTWEDLGATSRAEWRAECSADWESARAELEARQLDDAEGRCDEASATLAELDCAELWALYQP